MNTVKAFAKSNSRSSAEYQRRINLALEYIKTHIDLAIRLDDIAKASHFSAFHFHRIFHAFVGETVNDYVSRKKMEKAVSRLVFQPELTITEIAEMGGFSSAANFSKAFNLYFGLSPSGVRKAQDKTTSCNNSKIGKLFSKYGKAFTPGDLYSQFVTKTSVFDSNKLKEMLMNIKVKEMEEKNIAYLSAPGGYELESVYQTWEKITDWADKKGIESGINQCFAICHDNPAITPVEKCRYDASIVVDSAEDILPPYQASKIPAGKYAVIYYKDEAGKINNFMTELCSHWFPKSGFEPDDYPALFNYLNDSRKDGFVEMNVYIKIKELAIA